MLISELKTPFLALKYRISEWAEFHVWKFLHLQKLASRAVGQREARLFFPGEISIPETHGPFRNCIPVRVNQVIKGI